MIFVDTGVFYAQLAEDDQDHFAALTFFRNVTAPLVTTKAVVFETHALMLRISREHPSADIPLRRIEFRSHGEAQNQPRGLLRRSLSTVREIRRPPLRCQRQETRNRIHPVPEETSPGRLHRLAGRCWG